MPKGNKSADTEAVSTRQSARKRKVPDRYEEYVSNRAEPDSSPEPRSRSNSPASRKKNTKSSSKKKKDESESEEEVPSEYSDDDVEEDESEVEDSEEEESEPSDSDEDHKKKKSRGRGASKSTSKSSAKTSNSKSSSKGSSSSKKSFVQKLDENVIDELEGYSMDQLKDRLRDNDQMITGTKGELQKKIAECIIDGCFPRCPKCGLGKVKKDGNSYFCPGGYDDDMYKRCSWKAKSVERPKWKPTKGNLV